ncbi:hypothetical protein RBH26_06765 [Natronolimnohabitans sp. A-GB9]|nr:hypothetical protein [Natronolimnohabitans sp. A-GB9]MDQ2050183.1 hypothetical protein [Natronolimnohabitans sp. A-GB9]
MSSSPRTEQPVTCRSCGTENDHFYTYCRNCLQTLPSRPDAKG